MKKKRTEKKKKSTDNEEKVESEEDSQLLKTSTWCRFTKDLLCELSLGEHGINKKYHRTRSGSKWYETASKAANKCTGAPSAYLNRNYEPTACSNLACAESLCWILGAGYLSLLISGEVSTG